MYIVYYMHSLFNLFICFLWLKGLREVTSFQIQSPPEAKIEGFCPRKKTDPINMPRLRPRKSLCMAGGYLWMLDLPILRRQKNWRQYNTGLHGQRGEVEIKFRWSALFSYMLLQKKIRSTNMLYKSSTKDYNGQLLLDLWWHNIASIEFRASQFGCVQKVYHTASWT